MSKFEHLKNKKPRSLDEFIKGAGVDEKAKKSRPGRVDLKGKLLVGSGRRTDREGEKKLYTHIDADIAEDL